MAGLGDVLEWVKHEVSARVPKADLDQRDADYIREQLPGLWLLASLYFRADVRGLDRIPADKPVLFLAEGISMYLTEDDGIALLRRVVERFPSGELQIDFYNWVGIRSQKTQTLVRKTGSTLHWAVNSPDDILSNVAGTRLLASVTIFSASTAPRASKLFKALGRAIRVVPPVRNALQYHRYGFGPVS